MVFSMRHAEALSVIISKILQTFVRRRPDPDNPELKTSVAARRLFEIIANWSSMQCMSGHTSETHEHARRLISALDNRRVHM